MIKSNINVRRDVWIVIVILAVLTWLLPSSIEAEEPRDSYHIGVQYEILRDTTGEVTIEQLLTGELDEQFVQSKSKYPYFGYTDDTIWMKLDRSAIGTGFANMNWLEFVDKVEYVDVYFVRDDKTYDRESVSLTSLDEQEIRFRSYLFKFDPLNVTSIYLKLRGEELPVSVNTSLYSSIGLLEMIKDYKFSSGIFYGFMLSLAFYNLFLFFSLREKAYMYYFFHIITFVILQAIMNSMDVEYLRDYAPAWFLTDSNDYMTLLICIVMTVFGREFLETKKILPRFDRILTFFLYVSTGVLLFFWAIPDPVTNTVDPLLALIIPILLWVAALMVMLKGNRMARFYLLGWTFLLSSIMLQALAYLNVIPFQAAYFDLMPQVAASLEALFLSLALGDKINIMKRQREEEQERYMQKLEESDRMKDEFLYRTSHELKTPLHGIMNLSQVLLEERNNDKELLEKNLKLIKSSGYRMANMVNDILDLAKLKEGILSVHLTRVDLYSVVTNLFEMLRYIAKEKNVTLVNKINQAERFVMADEDRLIQVFYNLLNNSLKNTASGSITVSSFVRDGTVHIAVEDTGKGIPKQYHEKVFLAYERALAHGELGSGGVGLGLSISRQLVGLMNGRLYLDWSEVNKGSRFVFTLPVTVSHHQIVTEDIILSQEEVAVTSELVTTDPVNTTAVSDKQWKVLVVDDEVINVEILKEILGKEGYQIMTAFSGEEALQSLEYSKPDLILLDVMLPEMSGFEVSRQIRDEYSLIDIPILFVTVRDSIEDIHVAYLYGGNDYVTKPFEAEEIRARVRTLLTMKELAEEATRNELAYLQSQIKPHFLYNSLNTIIYFCYQDSERAAELLLVFTEYLRYIFQKNIEEERVTIMKEMEFVEGYVTLQKARFKDRLHFKTKIDESLLNYEIPILSIQPLVENAINHGVMKKKEGGTVEVNITESGGRIHIAVMDDGVGMSDEQVNKLFVDNKQTKGIGLINVNKRIMKLTREGITISSTENKGTSISFSIIKQ